MSSATATTAPSGWIVPWMSPTKTGRYHARTQADANSAAGYLRAAGYAVGDPLTLADALKADNIDPADTEAVRRFLGLD